MTHEEIQAAIERLQSMRTADRDLIVGVCRAFLGGNEVIGDELHYTLIELLEQADPYTHIELPRDADGVPIHVGDEMDAEYCDYCEGGKVVGIQYYESCRTLVAVRPNNWSTASWHDSSGYRHHNKPTVEDVLNEYTDKWNNVFKPEEEAALVLEYADRLREVMADDE